MDIPPVIARLGNDLAEEIMEVSTEQEIPKGTEILREGQYVKVVPIVIDGLLKVFTRHEDRELLLYYIRPSESCVMSFSAGLENESSKIFAVAEEDTTVLLIPADRVSKLTREFPVFNSLFFQQYNLRYSELLDTIHHVLFDKMDKRLYDYLEEKIRLTGRNPIKLSHREIAGELGTAREVISRVMKKLEGEGKLIQHSSSIELIDL